MSVNQGERGMTQPNVQFVNQGELPQGESVPAMLDLIAQLLKTPQSGLGSVVVSSHEVARERAREAIEMGLGSAIAREGGRWRVTALYQ